MLNLPDNLHKTDQNIDLQLFHHICIYHTRMYHDQSITDLQIVRME